MQPLCAQWLCDGGFSGLSHHRATEHTKVAQSNSRSDETEESKNDKCSGIGLESNPVDYDHVFETTSNQTPPNGAASATRLTARHGGQRRFPLDKVIEFRAQNPLVLCGLGKTC